MMRKLSFALTAVALALATVAFQANAQNQERGANAIVRVLKSASPIVKADCESAGGLCGCGRGMIDACWRQRGECCGRCVPCN
jgi:hypothetical protein